MDDQKYVTRLMRARCSKGTMENYLNVDIDHGIVVGADMQPLMNANDHVAGMHVIHFGCCESDQNPERMFRKGLVGGLLGGPLLGGILADVLEDVGIMTCKCKPNTPNPWEFVNEDSIVEGAPALMVCSTLTCRYGGVIEIIDPDGDGNIDIPPEDTIEDKPLTPEEWSQVDELFPELDKFVQQILDVAGNDIGLETEIASIKLPVILPDGSTITYSTSVTIKEDDPNNFLTIKSAIAKQVLSIRGSNWSIDSKQNIKSTFGHGFSATASPDGITFSVQIGENRNLDEFTTLYAPIHSYKFIGFGIMQYSVESKTGMDTPNIKMDTSLKWEKTLIDQKTESQPEIAWEEVLEPQVVTPQEPAPWEQGGWIYNTVDNIGNAFSSAIDGFSREVQMAADNTMQSWKIYGPIVASYGVTMLCIGGLCVMML